MIRKLKIKFIILAMTALFSLLCVIVVGMNLINYSSVVGEADMILSVISRNKGMFPNNGKDHGNRLPMNMSPETPYESRFFTVIMKENGTVLQTEMSKIAAVNSEEAKEYAKKAFEFNKQNGFIEKFRFKKSVENNILRITFLDCGRSLDSFYVFLESSITMALVGFIIVFFVILFFSDRIIQPIAESYEKQKHFITDAGHEIKTPLTIINANIDILELELGKNEGISEIKQQTNRLKSLTNDLVLLARMEESEKTLQKIDFPISEVALETVAPFRVLALQQNKEFTCSIEPMLTLNGNTKSIEQLISILMDNALKYSPFGGTVSIEIFKQNKSIHLSVFNTTAYEVKSENLQYVFDRFYRTDSSRNSETGGYGIGLSVAQAIVSAHSGKIYASSNDGYSFRVTAILPM